MRFFYCVRGGRYVLIMLSARRKQLSERGLAMVRHIVWWTLKPEADGRSAEENAELMKKAARGLMGRIPGLLSLDISSAPLQSSTVPLHLVLCCTHTDEEALKGYAVHPLHLECINIMKNVAESRQALDYEIQE